MFLYSREKALQLVSDIFSCEQMMCTLTDEKAAELVLFLGEGMSAAALYELAQEPFDPNVTPKLRNLQAHHETGDMAAKQPTS